jgi:hypothetical protein
LTNRSEWNIGNFTDILRYSISLDEVEKVASLGRSLDGGLAMYADDGVSIYIFGGSPYPTVVQKFNTLTKVTLQLPMPLPSKVAYAGGVSVNGTIYIFNGFSNSILEFDQELETAEIIGNLPFLWSDTSVDSTVAIPSGESGVVWLFAGNNPRATNPLLFFNLTDKSVSIPSMDTTLLPSLYAQSASVWDGRYGYLIGALGRVPERDGSLHPRNGILK